MPSAKRTRSHIFLPILQQRAHKIVIPGIYDFVPTVDLHELTRTNGGTEHSNIVRVLGLPENQGEFTSKGDLSDHLRGDTPDPSCLASGVQDPAISRSAQSLLQLNHEAGGDASGRNHVVGQDVDLHLKDTATLRHLNLALTPLTKEDVPDSSNHDNPYSDEKAKNMQYRVQR